MAGRRAGSCRLRRRGGDRDALDVATGSCRNRLPLSAKSSGSPVVRKRIEPSRPSPFSMPLRARVSDTSRAVSSAEKTSVTARPKPALEDRPDDRVVRAAEDDGVDARVAERRGGLADGARSSRRRRDRGPGSRDEARARRRRRPRRSRRARGRAPRSVRSRRSPRSRAARRGGSASRAPRRAPPAAGRRRRARRAHAAGRAAPAAVAVLHATTTSFTPSFSRCRPTSSAKRRNSASGRGRRGSRALSPR